MAKEQSPTTTVTVRIENDIFEKVKDYATVERRSINAEINVLLEEALRERYEIEKSRDNFNY